MMRPRVPRWSPGMHLKRWLILLLIGVVILGLAGAAIFIRDLYRTNVAAEIPIVYWLTGASSRRSAQRSSPPSGWP